MFIYTHWVDLVWFMAHEEVWLGSDTGVWTVWGSHTMCCDVRTTRGMLLQRYFFY